MEYPTLSSLFDLNPPGAVHQDLVCCIRILFLLWTVK
jgi:hypothetical protein